MPLRVGQKRMRARKIYRGKEPKRLKKQGLSVYEFYKANGLLAVVNPKKACQRTTKVTDHFVDSRSAMYQDRMNPARCAAPLSEEEQEKVGTIEKEGIRCSIYEEVKRVAMFRPYREFVEAAMAKYGEDYAAIARDIELNDLQHSEGEVRQLFARYNDYKKGYQVKPCLRTHVESITKAVESDVGADTLTSVDALMDVKTSPSQLRVTQLKHEWSHKTQQMSVEEATYQARLLERMAG
ncbi:Ribosome biogenesis protein Nop16 [Giardia duodenalis assemblage B]|uniref:Nucleolar protein 16 n=3 Tax=Giardia intestinalis TaxID=5741 RepID=A0A132NNR6_GIAIN|nr:Hypothetical protein GL50581_980 [Giardia intestinalis ATCC 50581]ESU40580.1 Ribosome biogenesis protein Nop16 [Giardia intestinalis]KWX11656.1 Ribosome biogenesis protein Nop16 [Giardia intestinalis assemblage B]